MSGGHQNQWYAVDVFCNRSDVDEVESRLSGIESLGIETDLLGKRRDEIVRVTAYLEDAPDDTWLAEILAGTDVRIECRVIEDADWLAEWKKHWRPVQVGSFVIAPPWEKVGADSGIPIYIEPNMAFGTGTHATTQLCLAAISANYVPGASFLDVGCGTGILSIAAAKLNAGEHSPRIIGYDVDRPSVEIASKNAEVNEVGDLVEFSLGTLSHDATPADYLCANVTLDVILPMLDLLIAKSRKRLILSGILVEQQPAIEDALAERGFRSPLIDVSGEWIAVSVALN